MRARVHKVRPMRSKCFVVLREQFSTIQAIAFVCETNSEEMIKYISATPPESVVDLTGVVVIPKNPIEKCTLKRVEIHISKFFVVNRGVPKLPIQI